MAQNQVTLKGMIDPQAVCNTIIKKTKRRAKVLSPLPPAEGETVPQVVSAQVCKHLFFQIFRSIYVLEKKELKLTRDLYREIRNKYSVNYLDEWFRSVGRRLWSST